MYSMKVPDHKIQSCCMTCTVELVVPIVYSQMMLNWHMTKPLRLQILTTNDKKCNEL